MKFINFIDETGWVHHHINTDERVKKPFADGPFVNGLILTALIITDIEEAQLTYNFLRPGFYAREKEEFLRDPRMLDDYEMNRDQWTPLLFPYFMFNPELAKKYYRLKFMWLNHALHMKLSQQKKPSCFYRWFAEKFEAVNISFQEDDDFDSFIHITNRIALICYFGLETSQTKKNWIKIRPLLDLGFEIYFTRDIPGDAPGHHPPLHKLWFKVIEYIDERLLVYSLL